MIACLDMNSRTVLDYLENDAIYVTGPSGMTSLLLGQMEVLGNFETVALKRHYLSAAIAMLLPLVFIVCMKSSVRQNMRCD